MTDRERLLQILNVAIYPHEGVDPLEAVTDYLLDNGVTFAKDTNVHANPVVPGHDDQYNIAEMSYNNGYAKGCEDSKQKWIPVSERLPVQGQEVIVYTGNVLKPCVMGYLFWNPEYDTWARVTHWMPLPEPPKEDTVKP